MLKTINRGNFEYKMSKEMAKGYLSLNKKSKKIQGNPQQALIDWVNNEFGIKGTCIRVITN